MDRRLLLHEKLKEILGSNYVYFQPPESVKMSYPCIKYDFASIDVKSADDNPYRMTRRYTVQVIDRNPDSEIPKNLLESFSMITSERFYKADNLNHFTFVLYY